MASDRTRGPYAKSADTKAVIARAALELVREKGHSALTTAEVSKRAGVSEATRFYHFPTRDHLLVAALRAADTQAAERLERQLGTDTDLISVPQLVDALNETDDRLSHLFTAMQAAAPNPAHPAHCYFQDHYQRAIVAFAEAIRRRQSAGLAHPDLDPDAIARQLMGVWTGLRTIWLIDPTFDLVAEVQQAFRQLTGQTAMEVKQAIDALMIKN